MNYLEITKFYLKIIAIFYLQHVNNRKIIRKKVPKKHENIWRKYIVYIQVIKIVLKMKKILIFKKDK